MKALLALMFAVLLGAAAAGCRVHVRPGHFGVRVDIPVGHVHTDHCGHYYHGGHWYHHHNHHHGHGCGHMYRGGMWIVVD